MKSACEASSHFKLKKNIFIFGCAGSLLLCGLLSSFGEQGYSLVAEHGCLNVVASLVVEHGLQGAGLVTPWHVDSFLDQGGNLCPLPWQGDF